MTDPDARAAGALDAKDIVGRYREAKQRRGTWEAHWQECYDYALPQRDTFQGRQTPGAKRTDKLYDGTAPDAVDQLAASLLAELTPPWLRWFGFAPGRDLDDEERARLAEPLETAAEIMLSHFERANFAVEMHQCFLDLVTAGTACLLFEEAPAGEASAFRFTAVPLSEVVFEESASGRLETTFRRTELKIAQFKERFPKAELPEALRDLEPGRQGEAAIGVVEAVVPVAGGYQYRAVMDTDAAAGAAPRQLAEGRFRHSPFINFRWLKAPGEVYGRSPVMKTLPDIKTANKVVELVLKNASIAVTGIWQADDDGVLNPATIKLVPGTIIPKAVGSAGLTPLESPGRFDLSQLVLDDLRARIRSALLADRLGQIDSPRMTATEVLERSAEIARVLGATYGRLQSELLTPLIRRGAAILERRGEIEALKIDGHRVDLEYKSPLARNQARQEAQNTLQWLEAVQAMGPEAAATVDLAATARWLGRAFGVPQELMHADEPAANAETGAAPPEVAAGLEQVLGAVAGALGAEAGPPVGSETPLPPEVANVQV